MTIQETIPDTCKAIKRNGEPCTCAPVRGTDFCYFHSPRQKAKKKSAPIITEKDSFDLTTIEGINSLLSLVVKGLLAKRIDQKTAQCVGYNLNILSRNLGNIDLARRVEELERQMEANYGKSSE